MLNQGVKTLFPYSIIGFSFLSRLAADAGKRTKDAFSLLPSLFEEGIIAPGYDPMQVEEFVSVFIRSCDENNKFQQFHSLRKLVKKGDVSTAVLDIGFLQTFEAARGRSKFVTGRAFGQSFQLLVSA